LAELIFQYASASIGTLIALWPIKNPKEKDKSLLHFIILLT